MKKILLLALTLVLVSTLLMGCDESFGLNDTTNPPADSDGVSDKTESENNNSQSGNTDINGDGVIDENDRIPDDSTSENPGDDSSTTPPSGSDTPAGPATIEYEQDLRLAESPDDMIFTCMGASNKTLAGSVTVEATYKGEYPVVSIWLSAFAGCTGITDVAIQEGIAYIRQNAFAGCTSMTKIYLPSTIVSIGTDVFDQCKSLTDIYFAGTQAQWEAISKDEYFHTSVAKYVIHCTDGDIVVDQQ